ncbi:hypothetical protein Scep_009753 [Stephania cephalantha]|uniref:Uncharacterized protein n=1 Tax=Stephania cephalantha TaxID=152367 RepID=A0AAP0JW85_9MAGN
MSECLNEPVTMKHSVVVVADDESKCVYCVHPAYTNYIAAWLGFLSIHSLAAYDVAVSGCFSNPSLCANVVVEDDLFLLAFEMDLPGTSMEV